MMWQYFVDGLFKANCWQIRISRIAGVRYLLGAHDNYLDPGQVVVLLDAGQEVLVHCPAQDVMAEWRRYNNTHKEQMQ